MTRNRSLIVLILGLFVVAAIRLNGSSGTDISPSYVSCRLMLTGQTNHLYAHDLQSFNTVSDTAWVQVAQSRGIPPTLFMAPFVQTPLWPYVLEPLCARTYFPAFNRIFEVVLLVCFAALIWLTGRYWAPRFFTPLWVLLMAFVWIKADPLRYALMLTQTHAIFLVLTLIAVLCARSERSVWAGAPLALAATVKITPAVLIVYWLMTKKKRAALSFVVCFATLTVLTLAVSGREVFAEYLQNMSRISNTLLLASVNQSFPAWLMGHFYPSADLMALGSFTLPPAIKTLCLALVVLCAALGGYLDRRLAEFDSTTPPFGVVFALLGSIVFTPIAWAHYYIFLVVPLILILDEALRGHSALLVLLLVTTFSLANFNVLERQLHSLRLLHLPALEIVRGQFYAGILAMIGMLLLYRRARTQANAS